MARWVYERVIRAGHVCRVLRESVALRRSEYLVIPYLRFSRTLLLVRVRITLSLFFQIHLI